MPHQGGLPGAVLPDYGDGLSLPYGEVDVGEGGHAVLVDERDAPELYESQRPFSSSAISSGVSGTLESVTPSLERAL